MKLVGLISGGKDSIYNIMQCVAAGHKVVAVANIEPEKEEEMDSYMYQSIGHQAVSLIAAALGLPLYRQKSKGRAFCKDKTYAITASDEVEDLFQLLIKVKREMAVEGVSVGAIASDYQRTRVENVCRRLGLRCFAYLWRRNQEELLDEMVLAEVDAIIIKVASAGLTPEHHLGRPISELSGFLKELNKKYGVNVCGEGGEYETLTLDCPLYNRKIKITESEDVILSDNAFAPVAFLNVKSAELIGKYLENSDPVQSAAERRTYVKSVVRNPYSFVQDCVDEVSENIFPRQHKKIFIDLPFPFGVDTVNESVEAIPEYWKKPGASKIQSMLSVSSTTTIPLDTTNCHYNYSSGWCCIGNISGATITDALTCLQKHLEIIQFEFKNLVFINIYVKDMSEFANINKVYSLFIPDKRPPARVCVGTLLPADTGVLLCAVGHKLMSRSQKVLSSGPTVEKENLYVQSISHWAPANIGPYSQCFKVGGLYYLAGQIPLVPGTMEILNKPIFHQCRLSLRHVLRIMEGINENLNISHVFQAICYVTSEEIAWDIGSIWSYVTNNENAPVVAVVVTELPKHAQLEWEVVACSYENPTVISVTETVENYFFKMKRCCFMEPFASSMVAKVSFAKKANKIPKNFKLDQNGYKTILNHCLRFLRTDKKSVSSSLCMLKVFYRGCDALISTTLKEIEKSTGFKVVATVIPVSNCEEPDVILTITGIFH